MATLDAPGQTTASSSVSRRSTPHATLKLRDSCHACASSKLKCSKEKPTCSRCAKRGLTCEYVATKRGARRHDSRLSIDKSGTTSPGATATVNETQLLTPPSGWFALNSSISRTDSLPTPSIVPNPRPSTSDASSSFFQNLLSPVGQSLSSAPTDPTIDLDDFCDSRVSFSAPDTIETDFLGEAHFFSTSVDSSNNGSANLFDSFNFPEDTVSEFFALPNPHSPSNGRASPTSDAQSYRSSHSTDSACFCLVSALDLLKQLFPNPSTTCTASVRQGFDNRTNLPTIQTVIAKNKNTIEAVSNMLQCSCSQDGYLLATISLIMFKALAWYAAAARRTPSGEVEKDNKNNDSVQSLGKAHSRYPSHSEQVLQDPAVIGSYCLAGEDSARMAAQLVLSELHRAQRLVNQLSAKLKMQVIRDSGVEDKADGAGCENADVQTTLPFSAVMLDRLEVDLRKRLRTLSLEIAEGLRKE